MPKVLMLFVLLRRLRPRTAEATFERTVDLFTRKEIKRRNLNSTLGGKKSSKDLHSKSIASTLERVKLTLFSFS